MLKVELEWVLERVCFRDYRKPGIKSKWNRNRALPGSSATDVFGKTRLSQAYQVFDGDLLSRAISEQDIHRVFSEEKACLLVAQLE